MTAKPRRRWKTIPTVRALALILFLPILFLFVVVGDRFINQPNRQYLLLVFLVGYVAASFGTEKILSRN